MISIIEIEKAASQLRRCLRQAQLPELKLLCGINFFLLFDSCNSGVLESYVQEFKTELIKAATKSNPKVFFPDEIETLKRIVKLFRFQASDIITDDELVFFEQLFENNTETEEKDQVDFARLKNRIEISCLFVEYYPDLNLPSRGRLLKLFISADKISSRAVEDDIIVRNPIDEHDVRFLAQARNSVKAGRNYLEKKYNLTIKNHYRFEFAVNSTGARFTGDSLGVAFAVGAIAALDKIEVFRDRYSINSDVTFSGGLSAEGKLLKIDSKALKLKIYRVFHSDIKYLILPREHILDAWIYLSELEEQYSKQNLELVGVEKLEDVASDPRLVPVERISLPHYITRKAMKAKRSLWVEIPVLIVLLLLLTWLITPSRYLPWFDNSPAYALANLTKNSLDVYNRDSVLLWSDTLSCQLDKVVSIPSVSQKMACICDLNNDGKNEVISFPIIKQLCQEQGFLKYFTSDGALIGEIFAGFPRDIHLGLPEVAYDGYELHTVAMNQENLIITEITKNFGAMMCIRIFDSSLVCRGSYISDGATGFRLAQDINSDSKEELFFLGFNNPMECASLLVLQPDTIFGCSPPYNVAFGKKGNQSAFLLFPVTDLGKVEGELISTSNEPGIQGVESGGINRVNVFISESENPKQACIIYTLNEQFRVIQVTANVSYKRRYNELVAKGKLQPIINWSEYEKKLGNSVIHWTDSGWVTEGELRVAGQ